MEVKPPSRTPSPSPSGDSSGPSELGSPTKPFQKKERVREAASETVTDTSVRKRAQKQSSSGDLQNQINQVRTLLSEYTTMLSNHSPCPVPGGWTFALLDLSRKLQTLLPQVSGSPRVFLCLLNMDIDINRAWSSLGLSGGGGKYEGFTALQWMAKASNHGDHINTKTEPFPDPYPAPFVPSPNPPWPADANWQTIQNVIKAQRNATLALGGVVRSDQIQLLSYELMLAGTKSPEWDSRFTEGWLCCAADVTRAQLAYGGTYNDPGWARNDNGKHQIEDLGPSDARPACTSQQWIQSAFEGSPDFNNSTVYPSPYPGSGGWYNQLLAEFGPNGNTGRPILSNVPIP